jgi:flagellar biogenesis protein FliO
MAIKYERAVDQPETFAGEMILQIILLIVFLAWTLKRNLGAVISESYLSY